MSLTIEYFYDRSIPEPNSGCWIWLGAYYSSGYGRVGRSKTAHRELFQLINGPLPSNIFVCHRCDMPCCVNPDHLFAGTQKDNLRDCINKGRFQHYDKRGIGNPRAKLSENDVITIRSSQKRGIELAAEYSVTTALISAIRKRKTWKHI